MDLNLMNQKEMIGNEQFEKLRDEGLLLKPTNEHNGKDCPIGKQLIKCNLTSVVTMKWDPIGEWDTMENGVMKLVSDVCRLELFKTNGMKIQIEFSKGDFRYQVGDWLTMYSQKKMEVSKIF